MKKGVMKKLLLGAAMTVMLPMAMLPSLMTFPVYADGDSSGDTLEDIPIDEWYFPDANFREFVLNTYGGDDQVLTGDMRSQVKTISVSDKGIEELSGIEFFPNITELRCVKNDLTRLDVSRNTSLKELYCDNNRLSELCLGDNTELTKLSCMWNQLTELDVSRNPGIEEIYCANNQLTELKFGQNTALTNLSCANNQLTNLDISQCTALTGLTCLNNQLTELDVSKNTALTLVYCINNKLTKLNLGKNDVLTSLDCRNNQLTGLDVSQCPALESLNAADNQIMELDLKNNLVLKSLHCANNSLTKLDLSKNELLETLFVYNCPLTELDVSHNSRLKSITCYSTQLEILDMRNSPDAGIITSSGHDDSDIIWVLSDNDLGWRSHSGNTYFVIDEGVTPKKSHLAKGWQEIGGKTYYFSAEGILQSGLQVIEGKKYYFDSEGVLQAEVPSELSIQPKSLKLTSRSALTLEVDTGGVSVEKNALAWASGAPSIVVVNSDGTVTPVSNGMTTVTVSSIYDPTVTCTIQVSVAFAVNTIRATKGIVEEIDGSNVFRGEEEITDDRRILLRHNLDTKIELRLCVNSDAKVKDLGYLLDEESATGFSLYEISDTCAGLAPEEHVFRITAKEIGETEARFFALDESGKEVCFTVAVIPYDEWIVGEDGSKRHYTKDKMDIGWKTIGKKTYYFDRNGIMQTGWQDIDGSRYYLKKGVMVDGWQQIGGKWYFFRKGAMQTDWQKMNGKWYYLKKGVMVTGWKQIDGTWYYFNTDGSAARGWTQVSGKWYFFKDGAMQVGWLKTDGKWYYLKDGVMITGWKQLDGNWYFFDKSGAMTRGWQKIGGKWYFFKNGVMLTGWAKFDGKWYFFDKSGVMVTGSRKVGSKVYEFDAEGVCLNP